MTALLVLGAVAQCMQSKGGAVAKAAPLVVLSLLLIISIGGMAALSGSLSANDWREAISTGQVPRSVGEE